MSKNVLALVAHADDEVLGCGGALAKHVENGDIVKLITMTNGVGARTTDKSSELNRQNSLLESCVELGIVDNIQLNFADNEMDKYSLLELIKKTHSVIGSFEPHIVYTHHHSDLNIDHRLVNEVCMTIFRPQPGCSVEEIRSFEVMSSTHWSSDNQQLFFIPNLFVDIEKQLETKMRALKCYDDEMRDFPHIRSYESLEALAKFRGSMVGLKAAEAFYIERKIEK